MAKMPRVRGPNKSAKGSDGMRRKGAEGKALLDMFSYQVSNLKLAARFAEGDVLE